MDSPEEIDFLSTLIPFAFIVFVIAIGVVLLNQQFQKNIVKQQLAKEALKAKHQQALLQNAIEVQENERKRMAQDLHDELGATLSMSKMLLSRVEQGEGDTGAMLGDVKEMVQAALTSTRRISHELMPAELMNIGLEAALLTLASRARQAGGLRIEVAIAKVADELPWAARLGLYRIFSELINNTLKHAGAQAASIHIKAEGEILKCRYEDDGSGLGANSDPAGLGLKSLEGRVKALEGTLNYGNRPEGGFFAAIEIPIATPITPI